MTKSNLMIACIGILALGVSLHVGRAQIPASPAATKPVTATPPSKPERFDELVRDDFFSGKPELFDRAMKLCEQTLAKNPTHAQAMVWHGSGLISMASKAFQGGDISRGIELWQRGLGEMDKAVELEPSDIGVLIPRAATLLPVSRYTPDKAEANRLVKTGITDYERVLELQKPYFDHLSTHAKGELLFGLADGWFRLNDLDKSREYLRRITRDCANSKHATLAASWLTATTSEELQKKSASLKCIGCHGE